jgi:hypothetical protein
MPAEYSFFLLLVSGAIPVVVISYSLWKKYEGYHLPIFCWFLIRFITDLIVFVNRENPSSVYAPVVHVSILVETMLLIHFFLKNRTAIRYAYLLYLLPIFIFVLETVVLSSIFQTNRIANFTNDFLIVLLMFVLLLNQRATQKKNHSIIKLLFLYHAIAFVYFIFIKQLRGNLQLIQLIYPVFLLVIASFNIAISYLFWSKPKD